MAIIPRGNNTYLVRVYLGRDPITRKRLEKNVTTRGTLAGAKKKEAKMKGEKELGCLGRTPSMTLNTLFDLYTARGRHVQAESTQEKDRAYFDYYVRPFLGTMPLKKIDTGMIQNLFNFLLDKKDTGEDNEKVYKAESGKGLAPSTVRNVRKVLAAVFNHAVSQKLTAGNPVHKTKLPPAAATTANSLMFEEAQSFDAVKEKFWYGDAFVFQLHTGLRPQELMALVWEDVDFDKGTMRVDRACIWIRGIFKGFGPPKCKRSKRVIGLDPKHLEFLKIHLVKQQKHIEGRTINGGTYGEPKIEEWVKADEAWQDYKDRILPDGLFLIIHAETGSLAATAGAVHNPNPSRFYFPFGGELGNLVVHPGHRGKGLGRLVSGMVVGRFISAGYESIRVCVQGFRLAAIKTYLRLGFVPFLHTEEVSLRWQRVCEQVGWRFEAEKWPRHNNGMHPTPL